MKKKSLATPLSQLEPIRITMFQGALLYFTFVISTVDIFVPFLVVQLAGRDGWISVILAVLAAAPVAAVLIFLTLRFPRRSIIEYSQMILSPWPGRLAGLLYLGFILLIAAVTVRELQEIMRLAFLPHTPGIITGGAALGLSVYLIMGGPEAIGRVNSILLLLGLFFLSFVSIGAIPRAELANFLPVLENGFLPPVRGSVILLAYLAQGFLLLAAVPFTPQPRKIVTAASITVPLLGVALLLGTISIPVFGLQPTLRMLMPALEMSRIIEVPGLPRPDILIMAGWYSGIFVKLSMTHYLLALFTAQWAGLACYRPLVAPYGVIILALSSLLFANIKELVWFIGGPFTYLLLTFEIVVPFFILVVALAQGIKEEVPRT